MQLPEKIVGDVRDRVFEEADEKDYLTMTRPQSQAFIARLIADKAIGGVLSDFMQKERVRTYIKDAVLNRYSKEKRRSLAPNDHVQAILKLFGLKTTLSEADGRTGVKLYRSIQGVVPRRFVVVASGTYLKWETSLRKALLYATGKPFSADNPDNVSILLSLYAARGAVTETDLNFLERALAVCHAKADIFPPRDG